MKKKDSRWLISTIILLLVPILILWLLMQRCGLQQSFQRMTLPGSLYLLFGVGQMLLFAGFVWWFFLRWVCCARWALMAGMVEMVLCFVPSVLKWLPGPAYVSVYGNLQGAGYLFGGFFTMYLLLLVHRQKP